MYQGFLARVDLNSKEKIKNLRESILMAGKLTKSGADFFYRMRLEELVNWLEAIPSEQ